MERPRIDFDRPFVLGCTEPVQNPPMLVIGVRPWVFREPGKPDMPGWAMLRCGSDMGWLIRSLVALPEPDGRILIPDSERRDAKGQPLVWTLTPLTLATLDRFAQAAHVVGYQELRASLATEAALLNYYHSQFLADYWREQWEREQADPRYR